jgi:hypothetical protein
MAFGYVTYKTFAPVNIIASNLTGSEGCGLKLDGEGAVSLAVTQGSLPYAIVAVGASTPDGVYPGQPVAGSLEVIDQLGCAVQATASTTGAIAAGDFVLIDSSDANGTFVSAANQAPTTGDVVWGLALTDCAAGEQFILRFQPYFSA